MDTTSITAQDATTDGRVFRRRVVAIAGAAALAAGVSVALTHGIVATTNEPQTTLELTSWTRTPHPLAASSTLGSAATTWCEAAVGADSTAAATVSNLDRRGAIASLVVARGGYRGFCLVTGPSAGMWEIVDAPGTPLPVVAPNTIDLQSIDQVGAHADSAWGSVGAGVRSVVLHAGGESVTATVDNGLWTAWWPSAVLPEATTATVEAANGVSSVVDLVGR